MPRRLVLLALIAAGCGGSKAPAQPAEVRTVVPRATAAETGVATAVATPVPRLRGAEPCPDVPDATCSTLRVPLDRSGSERGSLQLRVAVAGKRDAPVVVVLSGGPGQPGLPFLKRARGWLGPAASKVRLVTIDQRGTGRNALLCPALQGVMGASDLTPPPRKAVEGCAERIGERRRFYATADTVEDLEALRIALGAGRVALDGISYGSFVAQRYALAYPKRVRGLVLDSVVPAEGVSLLSEVSIKATRRVLGKAATADLAAVVAERDNGPEMLDMLTALSVGAPRGNGAVNALRQAREGNMGPLRGLQAGVLQVLRSWNAGRLSQGLHASTLCADSPAPWGDASAPLAGRVAALEAAAAKLSEADLHPYDRATATGNGLAQQCLYWPPTRVPAAPPAGDLPAVPILLLAGDRDLSTPLEWARAAAERAPKGRLMIVAGAGHGVQSQGDAKALDAVRRLVAPAG